MKALDKTTQPVARKVIGVPLHKGIEKQEDGSILVRGKFTSDNKDEIGDIITRSATEAAIPSYRTWGNIRYMHQPRPVGKVIKIGTEDGLDWNEVEIRVVDPQAVFEVENDLLSALSVGIIINWEDIEFSPNDDGGWIINGYKLAEISLVDHPANYDAKLDLSVMPEEFRSLAREKGILNALGEYKNLGDPMKQTKKDLAPQAEDVAEAAVAAVEPVQEAEVTDKAIDAPVAEDAPDADVPEGAEKALPEEPELEDTKALPEDAPELVPTEAVEEPSPDAEASEKSIPSAVDAGEAIMALASAFEKMVATLDARMKALEDTQVVPAEAPSTAERSVETAESPEGVSELQEKIASLEAKIADLEKPAARKGAIQADGADGDPAEGIKSNTPQAPTSLRDAVRSYMLSRSQ